MHWILQEGFHSEGNWAALLAALQRFSIAHSVHVVVPKSGELIPEPLLTHGNVICIGSYTMRHAAARNGWSPGVFDLFAQDFEHQRLYWGTHLLNCNSIVSRLADSKFSEARMFVRPVHDSKSFAGRVFAANEFAAWQEAICVAEPASKSSLNADTLIQLSAPVNIHAEYRFWIVGGVVITQSMYKRGRQVVYSDAVDQRLQAFVQARLAQWLPHESFVMDVCDCENGIKIVEINTLNSSSFYAADVQKLVLALQERYSD